MPLKWKLLDAQKMTKVFLALGSNIGDRLENLTRAVNTLSEHDSIEVLKISAVYETEPKYNTNQPEFFNQVIEISTDCDPEQLLVIIKEIEARHGRDLNSERNAPRIIDIDILAYASQVLRAGNLSIPHPGISERRFVLEPWSDISPDFTVPELNKTVVELLSVTADMSRARIIQQ